MINVNKNFSRFKKFGFSILNSNTLKFYLILKDRSKEFHIKINKKNLLPEDRRLSQIIENNPQKKIDKDLKKFSLNDKNNKFLKFRTIYYQSIKKIPILEKMIYELEKKSLEKLNNINVSNRPQTLRTNSKKIKILEKFKTRVILEEEKTLEAKINKNDEIMLNFYNKELRNCKMIVEIYKKEFANSNLDYELNKGYIKASAVRDVLSSDYNFGNPMLSVSTFNALTEYYDKDRKLYSHEEKLLKEMELNITKELESLIDKGLEYELKDLDLNTMKIDHNLPKKPIIRTVLVNLNQPDFLLLEGDLNMNFDTNLEWERLLRLTGDDDFVTKLGDERRVIEK